MTLVLQTDREQPQLAHLKQARQVLAEGGLVIIPTETVYGLACDPSVAGAMDQLHRAKGRDANKPIARLVASTEQVAAATLHWTDKLQRLADHYWPGPLTIVLETTDGWTGFRISSHPVALGLAAICPHGLALTSANSSGKPDSRTVQEAITAVTADLALDGGPSAERAVPSTVVRVADATISCLREGVIPFAKIEHLFIDAETKAHS